MSKHGDNLRHCYPLWEHTGTDGGMYI